MKDACAAKRPEHVLAIDLGSTFSSASYAADGRVVPLKLPVDGSQVPSAVLLDEHGPYFGTEAYLRAWKNPSRLYTNFKTSLKTAPDESFKGGPTPVELTGMLLKYLKQQTLVKLPALQGYPQFGGNTEPAEELGLAVTIPASWGIAQQEAMRRALKLGGIDVQTAPFKFVFEPKAGCRRIAHEHGRRLHKGDSVFCADLGGGTFDIVVMQFPDWHEVSPPLGDAFLGGQQFTTALALLICEQMKISSEGAFSIEGGMDLVALADEQVRETALNVWLAAEDAKIKLSTTDRVSVFVQTAQGKREAVLTLDAAQRAWQPLWERMERVICESLQEAGIAWNKIDHVFAIGGSAWLPSLRSHIAKLAGRAESEILISEDSAHVVSSGAAEDAYFGEETNTCLRDGLGMRMQDGGGNRKNHMFLRPKHMVPAGGQQVERLGQSIRSRGERGVLFLEPFVAKPGIRCNDPLLGKSVVLDDREIIPLRPVHVDIELPPGDHEVRVGVCIDANGFTNLVLTPLALADREPIVVPLALGEGAIRESSPAKMQLEIALIVDCSNSMKGAKLKQAKAATTRFIRDVSRYGVELSLISMGGPQKCAVVSPFGSDIESCVRALDGLETSGGTFMGEAVGLAYQELSNGKPSCPKMAVLFSDGRPHCLASALSQGMHLKSIARVLCIGIGPDACEMLLSSIASSERDYFVAETPEDIFTVLYSIAELIHTATGDQETFSISGR